MTPQGKKRLRIIIITIAVICNIIFVPWTLVWAWILPLPDTIQEQVEEGIGHGFDGMIVYVDQAGKDPAWYTGGWKNRADKIPTDPHSLFKIASIGKLYVAVSITKLVNDGKLSLDKTLAEYFPELVGRIENAEIITLKQMVQHRSGIPNYTDYPDFWMNPPNTYQEIIDLVLDQPSYFEPGEDYGYSNTNYLLLTELIKRTVGYSKGQFIKERILNPLGLKNTYTSLTEVNIDDVMGGYYVGIEDDLKTDNVGSMLATAEDLGTFLRALNDGSVFDEGEQEIYSSIYEYEHTGLIPGYQSIARYHKDLDAVVIQFVNTANFSGNTWTTHEIVYSRIVKILRRDREE